MKELVNKIASYQLCKNKLLSRDVIIDCLNDIRCLLFLGYYETVDNIEKYIGEKLEKIRKNLSEQIAVSSCCGKIDNPENLVDEFLNHLSDIKEKLEGDVQTVFTADPAAECLDEVVLGYPGIYAISVYRIANQLYLLGIPQIPRIMSEHAHSKTGIDIHPGATIGNNFFIDHGTGIVIGETTEIGNNVKIYQGVTLGAISLKDGSKMRGIKRHPTIKDNVTIYSGASILGGETVINENCVIGGNVFITKSIDASKKVMLKSAEMIIKEV